MLFATDWAAQGLARDPIAGAVSLSGVHDLAPMVQFSFNADFKLDAAEAARLSPVHLTPRSRAPLRARGGRRRDVGVHPADADPVGRLARATGRPAPARR